LLHKVVNAPLKNVCSSPNITSTQSTLA